jgi:GLPGLI family protein
MGAFVKSLVMFCGAFLFVATGLSAQEVIDNTAFYRAEYTFRYKRDSTKTGYHKDNYHLDICKNGRSVFYSRATQYRDSVKMALLENGVHWMEVVERVRTIPSGLYWSVDKRFNEGKYHYASKLVIRDFRAVEDLEMPQWNLEQDTLTINGHLCHKATAEVAGRVWEAWYAPGIPINDGPWLLWGLPGLIIHAKDSNGYFKFRCENVGQLAVPYKIVLPADGKEVIEMKMQALLEAEQMYEKDFLKFETTFLGVISGFSSAPLPKRKYIPLYVVK